MVVSPAARPRRPPMTAAVLPRIYLDRARSLQAALETADEVPADVAEAVTRECLDVSQAFRPLMVDALRRAVLDPDAGVAELRSWRQILDRTFAAGSESLASVQTKIGRAHV